MRKSFALLFALFPLDVFARDCGCGWKSTLITVAGILGMLSCLILYIIAYTKIKGYRDKKDGKFGYWEPLQEKIMTTPLDEVIKFVDGYLVANMPYRRGNEYVDLSEYQLGPITTQFFQKYMSLEYINKYDEDSTLFKFNVFDLENHEWDEGKMCMIENHEDLHSNLLTPPNSDFIFCSDDGYPTEQDLKSSPQDNIYTVLLWNILNDIYQYEYVSNRQWPDVEWFYQKHFYNKEI
jgi:hypothetical protein